MRSGFPHSAVMSMVPIPESLLASEGLTEHGTARRLPWVLVSSRAGPGGEGEGEEQKEGPGESKNPGKHGFRNQEVLWKGAGGPSTRVRPAGGGPSGEHPRSQTGVLSIP